MRSPDDYELWTREIRALARHHGVEGGRLLDVGCGTGKSFLPFLSVGWRVTGCDVSPRMIELAAAKAPGVALHVCDLRDLPVLGAFELVLLLDDVVNYLTEPDDLPGAFRALGANVAPGGVLIFDVNLLTAYRTFFAGAAVVEDGDRFLVWRGGAAGDCAAGALVESTLDAFAHESGPLWRRHPGVHRQRHHPAAVLRAALADAGLECVAVHGHGLDGMPHPGADELRDTKALYIARPVAQ